MNSPKQILLMEILKLQRKGMDIKQKTNELFILWRGFVTEMADFMEYVPDSDLRAECKKAYKDISETVWYLHDTITMLRTQVDRISKEDTPVINLDKD